MQFDVSHGAIFPVVPSKRKGVLPSWLGIYLSDFALCSGPWEWFSPGVIGTIVNVVGIVAGGVAGLLQKRPWSSARQSLLKNLLGALILICGLRLVWLSLNGTIYQNLKLLGVALVSLILGKPIGRFLRLQNFSNRLGQASRARIERADPGNQNRAMDGFLVCTMLFCASPLGIVGAVCDGLPPNGTGTGISALNGGAFYWRVLTHF